MSRKPELIGTGLSGLVGSRIVEILNDYSFRNLDLTTGVDITDPQAVKNALEQAPGEVLLHCAAFTDVDAAYQQRGKKRGQCFRINVLGTRNLARQCARLGKYLIHISTDFVFDGEKTSPYTEVDQPHPIEWYGQTKLLAEQEVQKSAVYSAIVRIAFPFRASYPPKRDVVRTIMNKLEKGSLYPMFADQIITPTFIDDIAKALKVFIRKRPRGIYHVVGASHISPYELAKKINRIFGFGFGDIKKGSLEEYLKTSRRPYQKRLALSNRKAARELGIKMGSIDRALREIRSQLRGASSIISVQMSGR